MGGRAGEPMTGATARRRGAFHPGTDGRMKLTSLSAFAVGAGFAISAPVMAFNPAPLVPECPPPPPPCDDDSTVRWLAPQLMSTSEVATESART